MKIKHIPHLFVYTIIAVFLLILGSGDSKAESDGKTNEGTYKYHQKPLAKVKKKNKKFLVAISGFDNKVNIEGSPFNIEDDKDKSEEAEKNIKIILESGEEARKKELTEKDTMPGLLTTALRDTGMFEVVERKEINDLIREINFQQSKWVKTQDANTLGNIYGVQYIVTGDVLKNESGEKIGKSYYTIALRMYNVNTGEVVSSSASNAPYMRQAIDAAVKDLATKAGSSAWSCRVVGMTEGGLFINAGLKDDIKEKDVFYVSRIKNEITDPMTKEILGYGKDKIALIKVDEVLEDKLSRAKVLEGYEAINIGDVVEAERIDKNKPSEMELWKKIHGTDKSGTALPDEEPSKYSLSSENAISPENIMAQYGKSVVKIQTNASVGTGFIINGDGLVVTNYHVIQNAKTIDIKVIEEEKYYSNIEVVKTDTVRDLALLKMPGAYGLTTVTLGDSDSIEVGERVIAIGNPEGLENTISDGLISGIRDTNGGKVIQTSVPITHGSSGGPLMNMHGEVIGVIVAGYDTKGDLNFAVPINYVKEEML
ncbi:MAG: trypsin-like peptidase domain-containing protein [Candidatus Omnitrophica bacterium]|nr:trypsin-like peptidase domain-containing protein [Candidatus Omnitrophota bacterium]